MPPIADLRVSTESLKRLPISDIISTIPVDQRENHAIGGAFVLAARKFQDANEADLEHAAALLGAICSFMFQLDDANQPFTAVSTTTTWRSAIPADFSDEQATAVASIAKEVEDC